MPWPIEDPQQFIVKTECDKAAWDNGFRVKLGEADGWAQYRSTTVPGHVWLAAAGAQGPWYLALDHAGVVAELNWPDAPPGPGLVRRAFDTKTELYAALKRVYHLSASLPDAPLQTFRRKTHAMPQTTEAERLVVQRIGQDIFRNALMAYWEGRCPLTGISDPALLRASHIIPWKDCKTDEQRLDVHNGLLLSALWDAAFDSGLVSFTDDGAPLFSPRLSATARSMFHWKVPLALNDYHRRNLHWHRENVFKV